MADIEVPHPGASDIVSRLLSDALSEHPDVQWLGLVSEDGFAIASEGTVSVNDDAVAAGAVRMMIHVRDLAKAMGQPGTSQMFLEGSESGICVIDKNPWVLVVMGAPGVPIGLLRYEAREIAEAFPMGARPALPAAPTEQPEEPEEPVDWGVYPTQMYGSEEFAVEDAGLDFGPEVADDSVVTEPDGEPEIRWADEPTIAGVAVADAAGAPEGIFDEAGLEVVEELEMPSVGSEDFSDWLTASVEPADDSIFELAPPTDEAPVSYEMPAPPEQTPEMPAPQAAPIDIGAPDAFEVLDAGFTEAFDVPVAAGFTEGFDDLADLAPPGGPAIDLPPPTGPAFELPPPG